jgi:hypothetical protein
MFDHSSPSLESRSTELYVGYLPVPPRQRKFLNWIVPCAISLLCGAGLTWAISQRSPGTAVWDDGHPHTYHGLIVAQPYPILFADDAGDGKPGPLLLVDTGKHGGAQRAVACDRKIASVSGWLLHRDGRRILELEPESSAIAIDPAIPNAELPKMQTLGTRTLRGEIVDSKCFAGAMKPGEGKTHKECATLCIRGGIPPMFVTSEEQGNGVFATSYYLLVDESGAPLDPAAYPYIADPVEITGEAAVWNGLNIFKIRAQNIHRL